MLYVIATIEVAPGRREEFLQQFQQLAREVRQEAGCLEYAPMIDVPTMIPTQELAGEHVVVVVEKWESVEALERHLMAPHMIEFRKQNRDLMQSVRLRVVAPA